MDFDDDVGWGDYALPGSPGYYREQQYKSALSAHTDCRDPDHPGCESCCMEDEFDDES
jgi:hypothetical protein